MSYFKFKKNDVFINTIRANPKYEFFIHSCSVYINNSAHGTGPTEVLNTHTVRTGSVSLYEYNINRPQAPENLIHPFLIKGTDRTCFKAVSKADFNTNYNIGDTIVSSYRMSASITRYTYPQTSSAHMADLLDDAHWTEEQFLTARSEQWRKDTLLHRDRRHLAALKNTMKHYVYKSPHYQFSSSLGDKSTQKVNMISIPSIMYGSAIDKGTVSLKYFIAGSLIGELSDHRNNGELIQIGPPGSTGSGSVAGVVLYNEGIIVLTGSWELEGTTIEYEEDSRSKWVYFGYGANDGYHAYGTNLSASCLLSYSGSNDLQTITMMAKADYNTLNFTNNPTFISSSGTSVISGSTAIKEIPKSIKNTADYAYGDVYTEYDQSIYISKINIYDDDKNLIGVAKLAKPIRKTKNRQFAFKIKFDI